MKNVQKFSLNAANLALHGLHQALIVFSIMGWMFCETRMLNLTILLLTLFSWYGLGPLLNKGDAYGYCLITDIQWKIRNKLQLPPLEGGYIKYLADRLLGGDFDEIKIDQWTAIIFFISLIASGITSFVYGGCLFPSE